MNALSLFRRLLAAHGGSMVIVTWLVLLVGSLALAGRTVIYDAVDAGEPRPILMTELLAVLGAVIIPGLGRPRMASWESVIGRPSLRVWKSGWCLSVVVSTALLPLLAELTRRTGVDAAPAAINALLVGAITAAMVALVSPFVAGPAALALYLLAVVGQQALGADAGHIVPLASSHATPLSLIVTVSTMAVACSAWMVTSGQSRLASQLLRHSTP